jgi:hypothetical protein
MTLIENPDLKIVPASGVESVEDYAEVDAGTSARAIWEYYKRDDVCEYSEEDADFTVYVDIPESPEATVSDEDFNKAYDQALVDYLGLYKEKLWWTSMDKGGGEANPFEQGAPTEQIVIGEDQNTFTLHNFGEALSEEQIQSITRTATRLHQLFGDEAFKIMRHIVIHPHFEAHEYGGKRRVPSGKGHWYSRMFSLNSQKLGKTLKKFEKARIKESVARKGDITGLAEMDESLDEISYIMVHEFGHLIDSPLDGESEFFYTNTGWGKRGAKVEYSQIQPPEKQLVTHDGEQAPTQELYPHRSESAGAPSLYAETNPIEDFAESFTHLIFAPDQLDPVRRDALILELQKRLGESGVATPIQYRQDESGSWQVESAVPELPVEVRRGEDVKIPKTTLKRHLKYTVATKNRAAA